jgi:hypothetical protein
VLPSELTPIIAEIIALGTFVIVAAAILGYLSNKVFGALFLAIRSCIVTVICLAGYIGFAQIGTDRTREWATVGLVAAIVVVAGMGARFGRKIGGSRSGRRRGAIFVSGLWVGFCFASWIGHVAGNWIGLLTITLPAVTIFWLSLYNLAQFILPLGEHQSISRAFRCLLTFSAGTNYPYHAMEGRDKVERVPGNQSALFFSGPGIFLTGPDHVVAISNNLSFTGARGPGVVFTEQWEVTQEPMDLRPQQRAYEVDAVTKDGIRIQVTAFGPFQLDAGTQQPEIGNSFPSRARSVFKAFRARPVDIRRDESGGQVTEEREQRRWDDLYEMVGTHVMQDIIAEYKFNELCEPLDPDKDPRKKITEAYQAKIEEELDGYGIKILGGGISNLLPADADAVLKRRITNWQVQWQRRILEQLGEAEGKAERLIGQVRAQVQAEMIQSIGEAIAEVATDDREIMISTVALRFIESLNQMVAQPELRDRLPPDVSRTMGGLPHIIGGRLGNQDV